MAEFFPRYATVKMVYVYANVKMYPENNLLTWIVWSDIGKSRAPCIDRADRPRRRARAAASSTSTVPPGAPPAHDATWETDSSYSDYFNAKHQRVCLYNSYT